MQHYMSRGSLYRIQGSTSLCSITCQGAHYIEFKTLPLYVALHVMGLIIYNSRLYLFMQYYLSRVSLYRIQDSTSLCSIKCYGAHYIEFKALPLYAALHIMGLTI